MPKVFNDTYIRNMNKKLRSIQAGKSEYFNAIVTSSPKTHADIEMLYHTIKHYLDYCEKERTVDYQIKRAQMTNAGTHYFTKSVSKPFIKGQFHNMKN